MSRNTLSILILAVILVLIQGVVLNNVCLFNVAVPLLFILVIIKLPVSMNVSRVLTIGFLLGLTVDIFCDTYGMNALACTCLAMLRSPILKLTMPRGDEPADPIPSAASLGLGVFVKYVLMMTLTFCILIFLIEAFTFLNFWLMAKRILFSTLLSALLMLAIDNFMARGTHRSS